MAFQPTGDRWPGRPHHDDELAGKPTPHSNSVELDEPTICVIAHVAAEKLWIGGGEIADHEADDRIPVLGPHAEFGIHAGVLLEEDGDAAAVIVEARDKSINRWWSPELETFWSIGRTEAGAEGAGIAGAIRFSRNSNRK
jgi:hypothetical protein